MLTTNPQGGSSLEPEGGIPGSLKSREPHRTLTTMRSTLLPRRFCGLLLILIACGSTSHAGWFQDPPASASNPRAEAAAAFARGQQALQTGDLPTAEASFQKVLSLDPQAAPAYANLGVIAMRRRQWDLALAQLEKAEKLDPRMTGIRLNIALVKYRREDYVG